MAADKRTAADLGAGICSGDEAGQGLRPPRGRTWAPRGHTPVARVRGSNRGRVSIAGVTCFRPGGQPHFFYRLHLWRGRKGEKKTIAWTKYRDLMVLTCHQLPSPLVWVRDNLTVHLTSELATFITENKQWLTVFRLPSCAPGLNPVEGVWSLLKRSLENFAAVGLDHLAAVTRRKLKKIWYRPDLIGGCLAGTGLSIETPSQS